MREFLDGNEAVVKAALKAGCDFFAGYPITPATSILLGMMQNIKGIAIEGEDELASIGMCIGASMSGKKVMTATSGPGMSLYSENLGLAIMGEVPLVIVDSQRLGPATGSATKGAQSDIQFVRWGTSAGIGVIALAPSNAEECYYLTLKAFNLAEELRCPVFVMLSKEISTTKESVDLAKYDHIKISKRKGNKDRKSYRPYSIRKSSDIPPFSEIGGKNIVRFTTSSHDEDGYLTKDKKKISDLIMHLNNKILSRRDHLGIYGKDLEKGAKTLLISYGDTTRTCNDAVLHLRKDKKKISHLALKTVWPIQERCITKCLGGIKRVIVPELNIGQYVSSVERIVKKHRSTIKVESLTRVDGEPMFPEQVIKACR